MDYRLLQQGEKTQEGVEVYDDEMKSWVPEQGRPFFVIGKEHYLPRRIAIPSPWIAIKDRKPGIEDGNNRGQIVCRYKDGLSWTQSWESTYDDFTHWMPLPSLSRSDSPAAETQTPQASSPVKEQATRLEAFDKWSENTFPPLAAESDILQKCAVNYGRRAFNAGQEHVANKVVELVRESQRVD